MALCHRARADGILKKIDRDMLLIWVEARDRWNTAREMQVQLDRDAGLKLLIRNPMGLIENPYKNILDKTAKTMIRVAQDLGFFTGRTTAAQDHARARSRDEDDPWTKLRLIPGGVRDGD